MWDHQAAHGAGLCASKRLLPPRDLRWLSLDLLKHQIRRITLLKSFLKLPESDVLKLTNSFPGDAKLFSDRLKGKGLAFVVQTKTSGDDGSLPFIKHVEATAKELKTI